jgi:capsular polysaccharide biosynthesis protein
MELRHYFDIVRRSWPLVVGLPLLVALLTIALWFVLPGRYGTQVTMLVTQQQIATNQTDALLPDYNNFNSWAASEYIVDDLLQLVETRRFAQDVAASVQSQHGVALDVEQVRRGMDAERKHRTVFLTVEANNRDHATWIAQGAVEVLRQRGLEYWNRQDSAQLSVSVLDAPEGSSRVGGVIGLALDLAIRTLLALLLAIGIAFLRHYLDTSLRRQDDVEALGLPVVGTIPVAKGAKGRA